MYLFYRGVYSDLIIISYQTSNKKQQIICTQNQRCLRLDQKTAAGHLLRLLNAHCSQNCRRNISKNTIFLLQAPAFRGIGHDEGDFVDGVGGLGLALLVEHFFGVTVGR